jgi:glycosyltransferase involved in cell wall biosynthesis
MLTTDKVIDRRIILEARTLCKTGYFVSIIAPVSRLSRKIYEKEPFELICVGDHQNGASAIKKNTNSIMLHHAFALFQKKFMHFNIHSRWIRSFFRAYILDIERFYTRFFLNEAYHANGDIYHVHDLQPLPSGWIAARKHKAKLIYDSHELFAEQDFLATEKKKWRLIESTYIAYADRVITINKSIAHELSNRYNISLPTVIRNCESKIQLDASPKTTDLKKTLNLPEKSRILLYQGGLTANRNLESLIEAMTFITNDCIVLVMLGNGDIKQKLIRASFKLGVSNRIFFIEAVPQDELLNITAQATLGIIPYLATCLNTFYCTPNKLFEFIAAGIPILVNNLPELKDIVETFHLGWVTDLSNSKKIAAKVEKILSNEIDIQHRQNNTKRAFKTVCWEVEEKKLISLYHNL